jgi:hypothetical protein
MNNSDHSLEIYLDYLDHLVYAKVLAGGGRFGRPNPLNYRTGHQKDLEWLGAWLLEATARGFRPQTIRKNVPC